MRKFRSSLYFTAFGRMDDPIIFKDGSILSASFRDSKHHYNRDQLDAFQKMHLGCSAFQEKLYKVFQ